MNYLETFLSSDEDGVFYIGHASALARLNKKIIAFDPVWNHKPYGDYWEFRPPQFNCEMLVDGEIDICVISHIHEDHCCERIIRGLGERFETRFMMCDGGNGRVKLYELLKRYGANPEQCEPYKWHYNRFNKLEFYFVPHAFNTVDSSCFVRNTKTGYTVYHGNDNFLSKDMCELVRLDVPRVDVAMVPYAFIHWYPMCMALPQDEKIKEVQRLNRQSLQQAFEFVDIFRPVHTIPFGSSLYHMEREDLNQTLSKPVEFTGALHEFHAGSYILEHAVFMPKPEDLRERRMLSITKRVREAQTTVPGHKIIVVGGEPASAITIDLEHRTVREGADYLDKPYHWFDFDKIEFCKWADGEITFEQAIGTRRFTCKREPNVYNLQVFEWMNRWL